MDDTGYARLLNRIGDAGREIEIVRKKNPEQSEKIDQLEAMISDAGTLVTDLWDVAGVIKEGK